MSLGRIGLDFRQIMVDSFEDALRPILFRRIDRATEELVNMIIQSAEEGAVPSSWMSSKLVSHHSQESKTQAFQPPMLLVSYPTLAIFTNGILAVFNSLRHLPALSLYAPIQSHLEACFLEIGGALKQYSDQAASHIPDEITHLQAFAAAYVRCCIPFLKSCLSDGIYGDLSIQTTAEKDMEALLATYLPLIEKADQDATHQQDTQIENEEEEENQIEEPELQMATSIENEHLEQVDNTNGDNINDSNATDKKPEEINNVNESKENNTANEEEHKVTSKSNAKEQVEKMSDDKTNNSNSGPAENDPKIEQTTEEVSNAKDISKENDDTPPPEKTEPVNQEQGDIAKHQEKEEEKEIEKEQVITNEESPNKQDKNSTTPQDSESDPLGVTIASVDSEHKETEQLESAESTNTTMPKKEQTNGKKKNHKGKKHKGKR
jgi:hypothetical protein